MAQSQNAKRTGQPAGAAGRRPPSAAALDRALDRAAAGPLRRELALALARSGQTDEAREVVRDLLTSTPPDAEVLGLVGRINKDLAERSATAEEARTHLQTALAFYVDGYRRERDPYCGINAATLYALLGEQEAACALAAALIDGGKAKDAFWQAAIRAEASLLLGRPEEAKREYATCQRLGSDRPADLQSAWTQARRLCGFLYGDTRLVDGSFGPQTPAPAPSLLGSVRTLREQLAADADSTDDSDLPTLRRLARELLRLQEEQRHALGRELHDNISQLLSVTTNRIALAGRTTRSRKLRDELTEVRHVLERVLREVGELSRTLRPPVLDQTGLAAALEKHAAAFRDRVKLDLLVDCRAPSADGLDGDRATNLFRIAQEALHNIEKHARATEARLALLERDGHLCLEVADNGCSFGPERAAEARQNGHLGLVSMRERAEMLGGTLEIHARPGNGTVVRAAVPLAAQRKAV